MSDVQRSPHPGDESRGGIGTSPPRTDGRAKVVGSALFVDDLRYSGMWHGATVRCPHPSARIDSIDPGPAARIDPEAVVVTAADLPGPNVVRMIADDWPALAAGRVRHAFEAVAVVAAPTKERAIRAAEAVRVSYTPLPAIFSIEQALAAEASGGPAPEVLSSCSIDFGDVEQGFADSDLVVEGVYETGLQEHIYIEPQGVVAIPHPSGTIEVVGSMQCPYYVHTALVHLLGETPDRVRVRQAETGGGFGGKEDYPDLIAAHAVLLARRIGRPVKMIYDRHEDIIATTKRHPSRVRHRTGVLRDGRLLAADIDVILDGGAYITLSPVVLSRGVIHAAGPYACPNVRIRGRAIATHTPPNGAFRGFGAPQTEFAAERHLDRIARALGVDPYEIRARNAYREGDVTPTGQVLGESVSARRCLEEAERRTGFRRRWQRAEAERRRGRPDDGSPWRGIGLSLFWHGAGFTGDGERRMRSPVALRLIEGGEVEVMVSSTDFGQGTQTVLAQMVADAMGIPMGRVRVAQPDTAEVPDSGPTVASRTVMIVGGTLMRAATTLRRQVIGHAAAREGVDPEAIRFVDGDLVGPDGSILGSLSSVAGDRLAAGEPLEVMERFEPDPDQSFDERTYQGTAYSAYGWGCDVVEVVVDPDTFGVRVEKVTTVCDVGRAIHPVLCRGQIEGGTLQALGYAYLEEVKTRDGKYLNDRLATYIIPTIQDSPEMEAVLLENPSSSGPRGAKGVGELPMDGGAPATLSAIENATGVVCSSTPATPERIFDELLAGNVVAGAPAAASESRARRGEA